MCSHANPWIAHRSHQKEQVLIYTMTKQSHQSTALWFAPKQDCHTLARLQAISWKPPAPRCPSQQDWGGEKKETCSASLTLSQAVSTEREEQLARHFLLCSRPPRAKLLGSLNIHTNTPLLSGFCPSCPSLFYLSVLSRRNHTKKPSCRPRNESHTLSYMKPSYWKAVRYFVKKRLKEI